jgi:hypothetical protein
MSDTLIYSAYNGIRIVKYIKRLKAYTEIMIPLNNDKPITLKQIIQLASEL